MQNAPWDVIVLLIGAVVGLIELLKFILQSLLNKKALSGLSSLQERRTEGISNAISQMPACAFNKHCEELLKKMADIITRIDNDTGAPFVYGNRQFLAQIHEAYREMVELQKTMISLNEESLKIGKQAVDICNRIERAIEGMIEYLDKNGYSSCEVETEKKKGRKKK